MKAELNAGQMVAKTSGPPPEPIAAKYALPDAPAAVPQEEGSHDSLTSHFPELKN